MQLEKPWGWERVLDEGPGYKVKLLCVKPGGATSLQRHNDRDEAWTVICGTPTVYGDGETHLLEPSDGLFVARRGLHQIANSRGGDALILELQLGKCDDADIERIDDIYGRTDDA